MNFDFFDRWRSAVVAYIVFGLVACVLGFENHGYISMEGMVEDGASHMLETGDWLIPHVYDEMYTYKPPLAYWMAAIPIALFGDPPPEWALRLPFVSLGLLLGAGVLWVVGRSLGPATGMCCAMATIGSVLFAEKVRLAEFDTPLAAFTGLAVALAISALTSTEARFSSWLASYSMLYLGFLAKGAPAVMAFAPGLLAAAVLTRRVRLLFGWQHLLPASYFAALVSAFVVTVVEVAGWQAFTQPADEAAVRGFAWGSYEIARAVAKPLLLLAALLPFSLLLPRAVRLARAGREPSVRCWSRASLGFFIGGGAAFVAVPTHEMRYFLPLSAAAGISFGLALADLSRGAQATAIEKRGRHVLVALAVLAVPVSLVVYPTSSGALALGAIAVLWGVCDWRLQSRSNRVACSLLAFAVLAATAQALVWVPRRAVKRDLSEVARGFAELVPEGVSVCTTGPADLAGKHASLFSYLDRNVYVLNEGNRGVDHDWCILVGSDWELAEELGLRLVSEVDHPYFEYHLGSATTSSERVAVISSAVDAVVQKREAR